MKFRWRPAGTLRIFGGAVLNQALLSAGNFAVGLILIRYTPDAQYGAYVLIMTTVMLLGPLQGAFIGPGLVARLTHADRDQRALLVGGLYRAQRRAVIVGVGASIVVCLALLWGGIVSAANTEIVIGGVLAVSASLYREFFRNVLMAYRRPFDLLKGDVVYVFLLVVGACGSALTVHAAAVAGLTLAVAAMAGGALVARTLWNFEPWERHASAAIIREVAPSGTWASIGVAIHWTFTQGYGYMVAALLNVALVAGVNATRLTLVPVGILSNGVSNLMLPTAHMWLKNHGEGGLMRRLAAISGGVAAATVLYSVVVWLMLDWIFNDIFHKVFLDRNRLYLLWSLVFTLVAIRDEVIFLLIVRGRFRLLAGLSMLCAIVALAAAYLGIRSIGAAGAILGMAIGEATNLIGVLILTWWLMRRSAAQIHPAGAAV